MSLKLVSGCSERTELYGALVVTALVFVLFRISSCCLLTLCTPCDSCEMHIELINERSTERISYNIEQCSGDIV